MLEKIGAEILCDCLKRQGVEVVFGIPGLQNLHLFEALRRASIRVVLATHEQGAGFMANGYSRATGKTGVFVTIPGPGLTNAFTAVAECLLDSCAVVGIVTGVRNDINQSFQLHEIQQVELVKPIAKAVYAVAKADQIDRQVEAAFRTAQSGEPGPAIVDVAANALWERSGYKREVENSVKDSAHDSTADLSRVIDQVKHAKRIGLFVGQGAADATEQIKKIAEWLMAPVFTTLSGRGCLREDHPLSLGFGWMKDGIEFTNRVLATCDLILAVGVKFSETGTAGYRLRFTSPLIRVDSSATVLGKNHPAILALQMDAEEFFDRLLESKADLGPREDNELPGIIEEEKASLLSLREKDKHEIRFTLGKQPSSPRHFFCALREVLPDDAIVVTDSGYNQIFTIENFRVLASRTLIVPSDYQSMGYAIPSAIGAAIAHPRKKVVAVVGDGGFAMCGFEALTALREGVSLVIVVFNDGYFGLVREVQEDQFGATCGVAFVNPEFRRLAESLHLHYQVVVGSIKDALSECIGKKGPVLLEVKVDYPPQGLMPGIKRRWKADVRHLASTWIEMLTRKD